MTTLSKSISEDELLQAITEAATLYGWRWHHVRRSDKALQMGHAGFPDVVLVRKGRPTLFFELKADKGVVSPDQEAWIEAINEYDGTAAIAAVIRPPDLDTILRFLE